MSDLDINDLQAQWLSGQRCIAPDALNQALFHCQQHPQYDLCAWLEQRGQLSSEQAHSARQVAQHYRQFGTWPPSRDFIKTHSTPPAPPNTRNDALTTLNTAMGPNAMQIMQKRPQRKLLY